MEISGKTVLEMLADDDDFVNGEREGMRLFDTTYFKNLIPYKADQNEGDYHTWAEIVEYYASKSDFYIDLSTMEEASKVAEERMSENYICPGMTLVRHATYGEDNSNCGITNDVCGADNFARCGWEQAQLPYIFASFAQSACCTETVETSDTPGIPRCGWSECVGM